MGNLLFLFEGDQIACSAHDTLSIATVWLDEVTDQAQHAP